MIKNISIDLLVPFENHPFKERSGIEQQELTESIKENGLLEPIIVRPFPAGKYEIISGHRRVEACKALGITSIPVTIKELTKDEAIVQMVDSNIHREHILPSEKAFAYKMKSEALKHQGKTSCQLGTKLRTDEKIAETVDDSARQIDGCESESANRHSVADGAEQHRRNEVGVRQIRHGKMLCAERQILCRTVEGVGSFGAVIELDVLKEHTAVIYMVLAAAPQPLVGSGQIQG